MSVPKLRFKDENGRDFPKWEEKTLTQANIRVIDGDRGENYPNGSDFSNDGYCLFLNAKNVTKSGFVFNEVSYITKAKDESLRKGKLIRNDLIITTRGTVGNIAFFDKNIKYENMRINSGMVIIRNDSSNINPNYIYKYFYSPKFRKTLERITFGSTQPQLTVAKINKFKIGVPSFKEQNKIADFLMAVDEKIAQLTQKYELLARYKKSVMQQFFSQDLRFKDDSDRAFPDWEEKKIKDFLISHKGGAPLTPSDFVKNSDYEVIPKKAISSSGKLSLSLSEGIFCSEKFFKNNLKSVVDDSYLITTLRDLVPRGPSIGYIVKFNSDKSYILAQGVYGIKINKDLHESFLIHYSNTDKYREIMQTMMVVSTQVHIRNNDFFETPIKMPSLPEQIKISNFLTSIDEKISQAQTYLETVKQYKQGLLQQMFV